MLERLRAGENAAFGQLFSRHSAAVYRLALGLVSDRSEAEDLTAEAFFRVLQAIRRGSGPVDNVRGYLLIVARRVAWEWSLRRRDVPVTDEELTHRTPSDPDTSGALTERNLIRRAFTSLPERWRHVLWKMEVEGERPAAVATNFGLSANATAALARRARQGLRAAYLQAHLAAERNAPGCRSVLEKLGAYTAGSTTGIEHRRIRAHLQACSPCTAMHAELRDVCSGLRAHAAHLAVPAALAAGALAVQAGGLTGGLGIGATVKGLLAATKVQVGLVAGSAAAVGALGLAAVPWGGDGAASPVDLAGKRGTELVITQPTPTSTSSAPLRVAEGELTTQAHAPHPRTGRDERPASVAPTSQTPPDTSGTGGDARDEPASTTLLVDDDGAAPETYDESAPVVYRRTTVARHTEVRGQLTVVYETTTVTEVNTLDQSRTTTTTATYTQPTTPPPTPPTTAPTTTATTTTAPTTTPTTSPTAATTAPSTAASPLSTPPDGGQQSARTGEPIAPVSSSISR